MTQIKIGIAAAVAIIILSLSAYVYILRGDIKVLDSKLAEANKTIAIQVEQIAQDQKAIDASAKNYNSALTAMIQEGESRQAATEIYNPDCSKCPAIPSGKEITQDELQAFKEFKTINWDKAIQLNNDLVDQFNAVMLGIQAPAAAPNKDGVPPAAGVEAH